MCPKQMRAPKILIFGGGLDQRIRLSHIISENVQNSSYRIFDTDCIEEAKSIFAVQHPDLIIVEDSGQSKDGSDLCRFVRAVEGARHTGIVFRCHRENNEGKIAVEYLELGVDDFIHHGCSPAELNARLKTVLKLKEMNDELRSLNHHLKRLSCTDYLTGLANMRQFKTSFQTLRKNAVHGTFGVIMLDLDNFKQVNDDRNHLVGSHVIAEAGKIFAESIEGMKDSVAARYGGDEYVIAVPVSSARELREYCERIRRQIEFCTFVKDGFRLNVTCSVGGAFVDQGCLMNDEELLKAADKMLYASKGAGRNRSSVCILNNYPNKPVLITEVSEWKVNGLLAVV